MFGSQILDVIIGLIFVYLLLAIICMAIGELIASLFSLRARNLAKAVANLLSDTRIKGLDELLYDHPLIKSLCRGGKKPSYIPSATFALAFLDGIAPIKAEAADVLPEIRAAVEGLPGDSQLRRVLMVLLQQAGDDFAKFKTNVETWFDNAMARAAGWYKRKSQWIILILALIITGALNVDTIQIVHKLSVDTALRAAVVSQAVELAKNPLPTPAPGQETEPAAPPTAGGAAATVAPSTAAASKAAAEARKTIAQTLGQLQQSGIPLGWQAMPEKSAWVFKIIGLLLTAFAVSLGAPFWFDTLNRLTRLRASGTVPETSKKPA